MKQKDEFIIGPYQKLHPFRKQMLFKHYSRTENFWRHWTHTIWSIPSIASAINVGTYSVIFDSNKNIDSMIKIFVMFMLVFLNIALTLGLWKHSYMQKMFGSRLQNIEKYASIEPVQMSKLQKRISASGFYILLMVIILVISIIAFFYVLEKVCAFSVL